MREIPFRTAGKDGQAFSVDPAWRLPVLSSLLYRGLRQPQKVAVLRGVSRP
jgi:hypothetical protein